VARRSVRLQRPRISGACTPAPAVCSAFRRGTSRLFFACTQQAKILGCRKKLIGAVALRSEVQARIRNEAPTPVFEDGFSQHREPTCCQSCARARARRRDRSTPMEFCQTGLERQPRLHLAAAVSFQLRCGADTSGTRGRPSGCRRPRQTHCVRHRPARYRIRRGDLDRSWHVTDLQRARPATRSAARCCGSSTSTPSAREC